MDKIDLAQVRDRGRAFVSAVLNPMAHEMREGAWLAEDLLAFQKGLFSMELWCSENSYFCVRETCCMNID